MYNITLDYDKLEFSIIIRILRYLDNDAANILIQFSNKHNLDIELVRSMALSALESISQGDAMG